MAAALLAKLKINNPPALQKTLEIKINGDKAAPAKALEKALENIKCGGNGVGGISFGFNDKIDLTVSIPIIT